MAAVRADAISVDPVGNPTGEYYALHIRRGDFQYKVGRRRKGKEREEE